MAIRHSFYKTYVTYGTYGLGEPEGGCSLLEKGTHGRLRSSGVRLAGSPRGCWPSLPSSLPGS